MSDLAHVDLVEAARLIREKALSPVEYLRALLERIESMEPTLSAFVHLDADGARQAARRAEAAVLAGGPLGPLHGVPYGLKDIFDARDLPTTAHSKILARNVAREDATVTAKLRASGAVLLGKLGTHEFALGGPSFDLPWPPPRNPWNPRMMSGGSSTGSAVAVTAGLLPVALGSDTAGSIRNPAAACGVVGMKATYGRVSRHGVIPLSFTLDHVGPLTRTVADNALALGVIAGHDPHDPGSVRRPVPDFGARIGRDIAGMKVGAIRHFHLRDMTADPEMTAAIEAALAVLAGLGAEIIEIEVRPLQDYVVCNRIILQSEAYAVHSAWLRERPEDYGAIGRERLLTGAFLSAADYVQATRSRRQLAAEFNASIAKLDVVVAANSFDPACAIDDAEAIKATLPRQARLPFNVTGHPALALPVGFSAAGMPLSMQIVGKLFDEATVYQVAHAYERATPWKDRRPPLEAGARTPAA
jgi:aspartyl-tRNA(Asn)/glutamyl-tRNA(Gln) amidotransferase subunit A